MSHSISVPGRCSGSPVWSERGAPTSGWRSSGSTPRDAGEIELDGNPVTVTSPRDAMALGIAYSTEDRRQLGLVMPHLDRGERLAAVTLPLPRRARDGAPRGGASDRRGASGSG